MQSFGTFVMRRHRKHGLASRLWCKAIETSKPRRIKVEAVSDRGMTLVDSLRRRYRKLKWVVWDDGQRKLRSLKPR
jgi:predicted GNAT family acetyltransferase